MSQTPHGPGGPPLPPPPGGRGAAPVPSRPPTTPQLRLLLRLTLLSLAVNVTDSLVQAVAGPSTLLPGMEDMVRVPGLPGSGFATALTLFGVVLTTALYALVWFPLREQLQWGWVLGLVFCSLAVLGDLFDLAVFLLSGHLLPGLSTTALVAVNVGWLVVAGHPGVRAALR
ncbi:hypothetical protein QYM41_01910 [Kocuria sp. CPCC 205268]|uniref:hypothetical protein n=1 Tax=Kocuria oxytropis TaxID=3058913 RepID=UPI0034D71023